MELCLLAVDHLVPAFGHHATVSSLGAAATAAALLEAARDFVTLRPVVRVERGWGVREERWPQPPVRCPTKPHQQP